uniref:UTP25 NTP hydrolase-like domain-containing protein n=1 Tax=Lygus hesperus TaxID=30085 RepID=A0A0A9W8I9_LYGHE
MRNIALRYLHTLLALLNLSPAQCVNYEGFVSDFSEIEDAVDTRFGRRAVDYQRQFSGNIDDSFCVGIRIDPDALHLYAHPLNSDLLLCSPLGLRKRLERNADLSVALSSIEVCVIDEAHVLFMQN